MPQKQGAGLGLGIVSRIAGLLKTEVEVKSKLGQGSCFSFKIPQTKPRIDKQYGVCRLTND